ncbi:hypothetical protein B5K11_25085 [Rhizobium leguminosarum bv. trifolii]|nr:hypothetical protein B5K11_25085 [Rhizobium leguminosarum bv. trifolii]
MKKQCRMQEQVRPQTTCVNSYEPTNAYLLSSAAGQFPPIHYAIFFAQNVNTTATSRHAAAPTIARGLVTPFRRMDRPAQPLDG